MKAYEVITKDDLDEFKDTFGEHLTLEDMQTILQHNRRLLHLGRMWGWGDTEVRESIYLIIEKLPQYNEADWG